MSDSLSLREGQLQDGRDLLEEATLHGPALADNLDVASDARGLLPKPIPLHPWGLEVASKW